MEEETDCNVGFTNILEEGTADCNIGFTNILEEGTDSVLSEDRGSGVNILQDNLNSPEQSETAMEGKDKVATWLSNSGHATTFRLHSQDMDRIDVLGDEGDDLSMLTRTTSLGSKSMSSLTSPGPGDDRPGDAPDNSRPGNAPDNSRPKRGSSRKKGKKVSVTSLYSTVSSHDPYIQLMHHDSIDRRMSGESVEGTQGRTRKISEGPGILSMMMGARSRQDSLKYVEDMEMEEVEESHSDEAKNVLQVPEHGGMQRQASGRLSGRRAKYANLKKGGSSVFDEYAKAMRDRQRQARIEVTQDDTEEHNDKKDEDAENTKEVENDVEGSPVTEALGTADTGTVAAHKCMDMTPTTLKHTCLELPQAPEGRRSSWAPGSGLGLPPKPRHPPGGGQAGSIDEEMEGAEKGSIGRFERGEKGRATWSPAEIKARSQQASHKVESAARQQSDPAQHLVKRSNSLRSVRSSFQKVGDGLAKTFRQFKGKQHKV